MAAAFQGDAFQNDTFETDGGGISLGLITQPATTFAPALVYGQDISLGLINRTAATFSPVVRSGTDLNYLHGTMSSGASTTPVIPVPANPANANDNINDTNSVRGAFANSGTFVWWWQTDLGAAYGVGKHVVLYPNGGGFSWTNDTLVIEGSSDGSAWTDCPYTQADGTYVGNGPVNTGTYPKRTYTLVTPVSFRHWRVKKTKVIPGFPQFVTDDGMAEWQIERSALPRIDQPATPFAPSVSLDASLGLISQTAVAFSPFLYPVLRFGTIDNRAVAFDPAIGQLVLDLLDQTAVAFSPTLTTGVVAISLPLLTRSPRLFNPRVAQPGVVVSSLVELLYNGVDIIDDVVISDATFTSQVNGVPGSCHVRVKDTPNTASFVAGKELILRINGDNVWRGFVAQIKRTYAFDAEDRSTVKPRFFILEGFDVNILFRKRVVFNQSNPIDLMGPRYTTDNTPDTTALTALFGSYLDLSSDGLDTSSLVENVGYVNIDHPASPIQPSGTWENTMRGITALTNAIFYIDPDLKVVHTDVDTPSADIDLSDQPGGGEIGYRQMEIVYDGTGLVNDALVWGIALGGTRVVIARDEDATSIAAHGRWQMGELNGSMYKQATVNRRAASIVDGSPLSKRGAKNDRVSVACTVFVDGFRVAQKVDFTSEVFDFNDVIPIRRMDVTFVTKTTLRYRLFLSHETDMPWGFFDNYFYNFPMPGLPRPDFPMPELPTIPVQEECDPDRFFLGSNRGGGGVATILVGREGWSTNYFTLYAGCTYSVGWSVYHSDAASISASLERISGIGGVRYGSRHFGGQIHGNAYFFATDRFTTSDDGNYRVQIYDPDQWWPDTNPVGATAGASVYFISGPDPRFQDLSPCGPLITTYPGTACQSFVAVGPDFTLGGAFVPGSATVFINGVLITSFTQNGPAGTITATGAVSGDNVRICYQTTI